MNNRRNIIKIKIKKKRVLFPPSEEFGNNGNLSRGEPYW